MKDESLTLKALISKFEPKPETIKTRFELKYVSLCVDCLVIRSIYRILQLFLVVLVHLSLL